MKPIATAITLFALAGLLVGFTTGAFVKKQEEANMVKKPTPVAHQKATPSPQPEVDVIRDLGGVGCPQVRLSSGLQMTNGTPYTVTAVIPDRSISQVANNKCGIGNPLHVSNLTCKLWIAKEQDGNISKNDQDFLDTGTLQNPFQGEIQNILNFSGDQAVKPCGQKNADATTWTYTLSPTTPPAKYFLCVLAEWRGQTGISYNWYWAQINVK